MVVHCDADLQSPGTDRDIDYYHRVLDKDKTGGIDLEMTGPPLTKWVKASSAGNRGVAPAPTLTPCGLIMNEGMQESDFGAQIEAFYPRKGYGVSSIWFEYAQGSSIAQSEDVILLS